jgi:hypothetical protein
VKSAMKGVFDQYGKKTKEEKGRDDCESHSSELDEYVKHIFIFYFNNHLSQ